ncbi:MAG: rod shape-determining protein RodA [Candidatus Omnitrophica bacterium]|nr:rod shape-determining protein RodA [Candidatus Omnitrophota bacterium]MDD5488372.1 rod shape-determining protein RodA [Candidatus Omnitrophota bacterium]
MIRRKLSRMDKPLLLAAVAVALLGVIFVYSATMDRGDNAAGSFDPVLVKQVIWVSVGIVVLLLTASTDYLRVLDYSYLAYVVNLFFLVFLLLFGGERYGARRWIGLGPLSFQPSEFVKLTVILALASFLGERREKRGSLGNFMGAIAIVMPAGLLIFLQPDLGTALVLIPILLAILFICGENLKYIIGMISAGLVSMPFFWGILKDYQKARLMVFINPNLDPLGAGYTIIQSKIAIGSGGLLGKGWLNGTQSHLKFLPERHTDFIFSVVGEEWGFVGAVALVGLYVLVISRGIRIMAETEDVYGRAIAAGVITLMAFQVFVNISMTIGFMPVVGLPLPAISYGGSNTITSMIGIGFLLSISRRANR